MNARGKIHALDNENKRAADSLIDSRSFDAEVVDELDGISNLVDKIEQQLHVNDGDSVDTNQKDCIETEYAVLKAHHIALKKENQELVANISDLTNRLIQVQHELATFQKKETLKQNSRIMD